MPLYDSSLRMSHDEGRPVDLERMLDRISRKSQESFAAKHAVMSFQRYLELLVERPYTLTRNSPQYLRDVFDHFESYTTDGLTGKVQRWRLFDDPGGDGSAKVFGQEDVQAQIYDILSGFAERGRSDRFILLHGPNGSAKSSLVESIRLGLERYSRTEDGPLFRMSWIFCESGEKRALGFTQENEFERLDSFAHLDDKFVSSRVPCEFKDPPFFLLPKRRRIEVLHEALEGAVERERTRFHWTDFIVKGELSPKNKTIYESLLRSYRGDWRKVVRHIRVERYYISHRYRMGAVTIEPQGTIDAGSRLLAHSQMSGLPPVLVHEDIVEGHGDLIDANAGLVEYSDFLKRSMEANKYLLTTAERGFVNLPSLTVSLNLVLFGTTNEKYLSAFKRDPSFPSFRGRFSLIRVPYLREYLKEAQIYDRHLQQVAGKRHVAPHTGTVVGLWAVLTRLGRPEPANYDGPLARIVKRLTPIEKARIYEVGELPGGLTEEEQSLLRSGLPEIVHENNSQEEEFEGFQDAAYEGRRGASPRELMAMLTEVALDAESGCITPVGVFEAIPRLISDPSLHAFLRIAKDGAYHDPEGFLEVARREYLREVSGEIQRASDLVDENEYRRLFTEYMQHVKAYGTGEKMPDIQTGHARDPDRKLMSEVEDHLGIQSNIDDFRRNLITKVAAFRLSNPTAPLDYESLFHDHFQALKRSFYDERKGRIAAIVADALMIHSGVGEKMIPERRAAAEHLITRLIRDFHYCEACVGQVLGYFQRHAPMDES